MEARMQTRRLSATLGALALLGLGTPLTARADDDTGTLVVLLDADPAAGIIGGTLRISRVWAHLVEADEPDTTTKASDWYLVDDDVQRASFAFPLGVSQELGFADLPAGIYDQVQLHATDGEVYTLTGTWPVKISWVDSSVLRFYTLYCVDEDDTTELHLSIDTDTYLRWSDKDDAYILRPNIALDDDGSCGD